MKNSKGKEGRRNDEKTYFHQYILFRRGEAKLLDYQTQQYRLIPEIVKSYAFLFAGKHLLQMYTDVSAKVKKGDVDLLPAVIET